MGSSKQYLLKVHSLAHPATRPRVVSHGESDEGDEGHEGHEGDEGYEGHEGHEGHEGDESHEGHEGHEGDESYEGHEGHEVDEVDEGRAVRGVSRQRSLVSRMVDVARHMSAGVSTLGIPFVFARLSPISSKLSSVMYLYLFVSLPPGGAT